MTKPPTLAEMEARLEHSGVRGMRWGVRKSAEVGGIRTAKIDEVTKGYTKNLGPASKLKEADYTKAALELRMASMADAKRLRNNVIGISDFHENEDGSVSITRITRKVASTEKTIVDLYIGPLNDKYDKVVLNHEEYFK